MHYYQRNGLIWTNPSVFATVVQCQSPQLEVAEPLAWTALQERERERGERGEEGVEGEDTRRCIHSNRLAPFRGKTHTKEIHFNAEATQAQAAAGNHCRAELNRLEVEFGVGVGVAAGVKAGVHGLRTPKCGKWFILPRFFNLSGQSALLWTVQHRGAARFAQRGLNFFHANILKCSILIIRTLGN